MPGGGNTATKGARWACRSKNTQPLRLVFRGRVEADGVPSVAQEGERRSMASPSRRKRIRINLLCTKCERQFEDWACFVAIETADSGGTLEWMPANNATMGTKCSRCGSEAIVVARP